jgi:hypothetical protein
MITLAAEMPKDPTKIRIEAHLTPDEFKQFAALAKDKDWSNKKLAENIIKAHLETLKKAKKK